MATRDFAVRTENHVANLGDLGKLEFVPEVFGDEFLEGYSKVQEAQKALVNVDNNRLTRALSGLAGVAGLVGKALATGLKFGAYGIAAVGAAQGVAKSLAALAPASGIIAVVPAAIAGAQIALGTLKPAVLGVDDALTAAFSGKGDEFAQAIEGLAPAAQKAVTAVHDLAPERPRERPA
ncbi:hypothetical protein ABZ599_08230 [Streptomyces misionensis]|uniref:hypothetical protein n=1 Tax=Streptomyces misionensis TaxID=67331 RepID=UPI0033C34DB1